MADKTRNPDWSNTETYGQARDVSQPIRIRDFTESSLFHIIIRVTAWLGVEVRVTVRVKVSEHSEPRSMQKNGGTIFHQYGPNKHCECSVKTQQGVSSPPSFLQTSNENGRRFPIFKIL